MIKRLQHRLHRALDKQLSNMGISLVQWNALREIDRNPGHSQRQLAMLTFNSDQSFGTLLTRLISAGWIERQQGVGRAMTHELTKEGRALLISGQKVMSQVTGAAFSSLTATDKQALSRLLHKALEGPDLDALTN